MNFIYNRNKNWNNFKIFVPLLFLILAIVFDYQLNLFRWYFITPILIFLVSLNFGIEFDVDNQKFRFFTSSFGLKFGNWKSLQGYYKISISKKKNKDNLNHHVVLEDHNFNYSVQLENSNQKHPIIIIDSFENPKEAEYTAKAVATKLKIEI